MDRGTWWAAVHGIAELAMTERLTLSLKICIWLTLRHIEISTNTHLFSNMYLIATSNNYF